MPDANLRRGHRRRRGAKAVRTFLLAAVMSAIVVLPGCLGGSTGGAAPDFQLTDSEGQAVALGDFAGKPVIILFASVTSCVSCIVTTRDALVPLHEELNGTVGFVTISILPTLESNDDIRDFMRRTGATWSHALDTDDVTRRYDVRQTSTLVVLDADHKIVLNKVHADKASIRAVL